MKFKITYQDIKEKNPCYDPVKYIPEDWKGTLLDILDVKKCSFEDRLLVVTWFLGDKVNRLFAIYCARQAIALIENPDPRSLNAIEVAEQFVIGKASSEDLAAARYAATDAARYAAWAAATDAATDAAWAAATDAATDAARYAAWAAARYAATDAARYAAWAAAWAAATDAARYAAWDDFEAYLRLLIKDELEVMKK